MGAGRAGSQIGGQRERGARLEAGGGGSWGPDWVQGSGAQIGGGVGSKGQIGGRGVGGKIGVGQMGKQGHMGGRVRWGGGG